MENKDKIEIPFGAKDSELCECEYTIPEGYEAEIKEGRVIIRNKESEDKKIRKVLVDYFKSYKEREEWGVKTFYGIPTDNILAWLEKQGEHAYFLNKIQIGDKVTRNEEGVLVNLSQLKRVAKKDEKQGEQNQAVIIPKFKIGDTIHKKGENTIYLMKIERITDGGSYACNNERDFVNIECQDEFELVEQKPVECSRVPLREMILDVWELGNIWKELTKGSISTEHGTQLDYILKHLTEGDNCDKIISSKQKPTWSEEDEMFVHGLIRGLVAMRDIHGHTTFSSDCIDITETITWLKSLKDRYTWKPSDEQMKALKEAVDEHFDIDGGALWHLYEDLKKLKD